MKKSLEKLEDLAATIGAICFRGWILQLTWNSIASGYFHLHGLTFWQALGIMIVLR